MKRSIGVPVTYEVMAEGKLVLESWSGSITRDEAIAHSKQHLSDERIAEGASALVDARAASIGIAPDEVGDIVDSLYADQAGRLKIRKCAILANNFTYELARAYERRAEKYGVNVIVFNALDVACKWLGVDASMVQQHLDPANGLRSD